MKLTIYVTLPSGEICSFKRDLPPATTELHLQCATWGPTFTLTAEEMAAYEAGRRDGGA